MIKVDLNIDLQKIPLLPFEELRKYYNALFNLPTTSTRKEYYNDSYINAAGQTTNLLPSKTVILGSRDGLDGTRCYGAIHDEKANWTATRYFTKSWLEEDPSVRWLLLQSAPLVVPYRPNAVLCATIG